MFQKLAARFRSSDTDFRRLVPLLVSTMLVQLVTAMVRVTTSYRAVELNLSIVWLGLIAATFAICPILIAVRVGRQIDRGYDVQTTWLGGGIFVIAFVIFMLIRMANRIRGVEEEPPATKKTCTMCATEIPLAAKRCPHCTSELAA